jgi:hypothetical protein
MVMQRRRCWWPVAAPGGGRPRARVSMLRPQGGGISAAAHQRAQCFFCAVFPVCCFWVFSWFSVQVSLVFWVLFAWRLFEEKIKLKNY